MATTSSSKRQLVHTSNTYQSNSDLTVGGDLFVNGSTTTIDTANLLVEDKNIVIGNVSSPSDTTADGGGITLKGAEDYTINWLNSNNSWNFNQGIVVGQDDTGHDVKFFGATSGRYLLWDESANALTGHYDLKLADSREIQLGGSNDLRLYHSHPNNFIKANSGDLIIQSDNDDLKLLAEDDIVLRDNDDSTNFIHCVNGGPVRLYHNGSQRLETTGSGVTISGLSLELFHSGGNNFISSAASGSHLLIRNTGGANVELLVNTSEKGVIAKPNNAVELYYDNALKLSTTTDGISLSGNGYVDFPDNGRARFGGGFDLAIYHSGSDNNNYIESLNGRNLMITSNGISLKSAGGENMITATANGAVSLYHDNTTRLGTTSTGIAVTGNVGIGTTTPSRTLHIVDSAGPTIKFERNSNSNLEFTFGTVNTSIIGSGEIQFRANGGTSNKFIITNSQIQSNAKFIVVSNSGTEVVGSNDTSAVTGMLVKTSSATSQGLFAVEGSGTGHISGTIARATLLASTASNTALQLGSAGVVRATIKHDGNVGIGTTSPTSKLEVSSFGAHGINISHDLTASTLSGRLFLSNGTANQACALYNSSGTLRFATGGHIGNSSGNTRMTLLANGRLGIGTTNPQAPLSLVGVNGGSWNDGLIIDDATGWAATVYKRNNSPKMFTGLYNGNDNYIWMSTGYDNSGTTITAPRSDAVLMARPSTDDLQIYLETHFGNNVGIGTTSPEEKLQVNGYVRTKNSKYKKYTSLTGSSNDWFPIYQVNDHKGGQVTFNVNTYAHSSCTFVVSEGYGPSGQSNNPAHINVLNYLYHPNGGYANITGIRVNQIGMVEIKLTFTSGPTVSVAVRIESSEELQNSLASSLATSTSTESIRDSVNLSNKYARFKNLTLGDDGAVSLPALNFGSSGSTGLYYSSSQLNFAVHGSQRMYLTSAGIFSTSNVYSGTTGQFRNFGGTWKGTTGTVDKGWEFLNTANSNSIPSATLSSTGTLVLNGKTTATKFELYETFTDTSNYERATFDFSGGYFNIDTNKSGTGHTASGIKLGANGYAFLQLEPEGNVLINGANDNSNKADFAVGVGGSPRVSWHGTQVQIGGTDMNYNGNIMHDGIFRMQSYNANISFECKGGSGSGVRDIIFRPFNDSADTEAMRIKGDGKVGIGTSSPNRNFNVVGQIGIDNSASSPSGGMLIAPDGNSNKIYSRTGNSSTSQHPLDFYSGSSHTVRIASNGKVGIGTSSPAHKLDVVGTYRISDNTTNANNKLHRMLGRHYTNAEQDVNIFSSISTSSTNFISFGGGSSSYNTATHIVFYTASNNTSTYAVGQERLRIHNNGNIGIAVGSPQQKLDVDGLIKQKVYTATSLPSPSSATRGARAFVSDSATAYNSSSVGSAIGSGGGSNFVPVYSDGSSWRIG